MYASIRYNTSVTSSIMLGDIALLLTGETNLANLSANVVSAESFITSTVPAGWTLWDDMINVKVFRSPIYDDPTRFKYLHLNAGPNLYKILLEYYTDWDNVTHTGTRVERKDPANNYEAEISTCDFTANQPQRIYISASTDHALFHALTNNTTVRGFVGILSHTRNAAWDTVANAYDPVVVTTQIIDRSLLIASSQNLYGAYPFVRYKVPQDASLDYTSNDTIASRRAHCINHITLTPNTSFVDGFPSYMSYLQNQSLDSTKTLRNTIVSFGCCQATAHPTYFGGEISSKCGIYLTNRGSAVNDDLFNVDGQQYRIWNVSFSSSDVKFAIKEV